MTRRPTFVLAIALLVGCTPANGTGGPVSYDQKVKRVEAMTQALSLGQNEELQKSLKGAQSVGAAMSQGAFKQTTAAASGMVAAGGGNMVAAGGGNLVAAGGGNIVAAGGMNYALQALVADLNRAVRHDAYALAATAALADGSSVTYDDTTGELQAVKARDAEATFTYKVAGDARTWTMDLTKSPDGTVGTLSIEIAAATWVDQAPSAPPTNDPWSDPNGGDPFAGPGPSLPGQGGFGDGDDEEEADFEDEGGDDPFALQQAMGEPPIKIFGGQQPDFNTVSRVRFKADFKAQGQDALRMSVDALLDEWAPVQGARVPARLGLAFDVASMGVKTDTRIGWTTLDVASQGEFKLRTKEAQENFTYELGLQTKAQTGKLDLTNAGAKIRFSAASKPGATGQPPQVTTGLFDSETGQKLADLAASTSRPGVVEIRFTDGRVLQWDPASGQTTTLPGLGGGASPRPSLAPTERPTTAPTPPAGSATPAPARFPGF